MAYCQYRQEAELYEKQEKSGQVEGKKRNQSGLYPSSCFQIQMKREDRLQVKNLGYCNHECDWKDVVGYVSRSCLLQLLL